MGKGRSDAGASFVLQHFPFTELLCLCLPISSILRGCNKTYLLPGVPGFDLRARTLARPRVKSLARSYDTQVR